MKKTISVNLNKQVFYLDVDAYDKLNNYLESIKNHLKEDYLEIIDDIEARIAEKFSEIIGKSKKVVQIYDVDKIIEEMGSVDDITGEENKEDAKEDTEIKLKKKLFRDPETRIIAGVFSGLSWYFGIRSIFIRLIFIFFLFNPSTFWLAIILYLASWVIIPEAKTNWEKLAMKGRPATVNELQTEVEEKTSKIFSGVEIKTRNILQKIFDSFFKLIKFCWILFCRICGFFGIIFTILTIMAIIVGLIFVYMYPNMPYFDVSFLKAISPPWLEIAYIALGVSVITPFIFILDMSDSLMKLKWNISVKKIITLLMVWIFSLLVVCGVAKLNYPKYSDGLNGFIQHLKNINSIDSSHSEEIKVNEIQKIDISSVKEVSITQGQENKVKIIGNTYQIKELDTNYSNGTLTIKGKNEKWFSCRDCSGYISTVRVEITTKNITSIKLNNEIDAWYYPTNGDIQIEIGDRVGLKIEGSLNKASINIGQNSVINMIGSKVNEIEVTANDGVIKTQAKKIKIAGDEKSVLVYKGDPQIVSFNDDKSQKEKYILSEDTYEKLSEAISQTNISLDGKKGKIADFDWSKDFIRQKDDGFYNIYTTIKLKRNDNKIYVLWLTEKDESIVLNKSLKIENWENVDNINLINDKNIEITGQIYGPEIKEESKEIYIDKTKNTLQIKPTAEEKPVN